MCEYLFAQFTLERSPEEGLTAEQSAKVAAWETVLIDVVKQEMLHVALACTVPELHTGPVTWAFAVQRWHGMIADRGCADAVPGLGEGSGLACVAGPNRRCEERRDPDAAA